MKSQSHVIMFKARAALEALRCGIPSPDVTNLMASYGRDNEIETIQNHILKNTDGSSQILVGGYGIGKSHLLEHLTQNLLRQGYAVATLELGSSNQRAEHPNAVVAAIERSFKVRIGIEMFSNTEGVFLLNRATESQTYISYPEFLARVTKIREYLLDKSDGMIDIVASKSLSSQIPSPMTAANRAVKIIVQFALQLKKSLNIKGFVLLFDEAERSEFAASQHRLLQAQNLMTWFATRAMNRSTKDLRTYRDEVIKDSNIPSFLHTVFAFTHSYGLANTLHKTLDIPLIGLKNVHRDDRIFIAEQIKSIYRTAYGQGMVYLGDDLLKEIANNPNNDDLRLFTRTVVTALDHLRLEVKNGRT
jgi:hypothetical protein